MAGMFLVRSDDPRFAAHALAEARAQFALHGFGKGRALDLPGWHLLHYPYILGGPESFHAAGEDFVAVAGTLTFAGKIGRPALEALLASFDGKPDWSHLGGQFVVLIRKAGRAYLFTDYFAAFRLYHDGDQRLFSTSFLSVARSLPRLSFDAQAVYEFVFNIMPLGDDTVFEQLRTLGPGTMFELTGEGAIAHPLAKPLPVTADIPLAERLKTSAARLSEVAQAHLGAFDSVNCPLSGGIDSRLALAVLRAAGARPQVYVYGPEHGTDVTIARAIGKAEGFDVAWVNKSRPFPEPEAYADQVAANFHQFDGLPPFGNIFDGGGNAAARDARHAGGALAVSGGCGEIYRNFFLLSDKAMDADAVANGFFARFTASDTTEAFDPRIFLRRIRAKLLAALDLPESTGKLPRGLIEQLYPRVRCRALFGSEISIEGRYGAYLMPFLDHRVVAEAMQLPIALKHAGAFEAALVNAIDPALARHMSAYGHDFTGPPGAHHRRHEWQTRIRPIWLRRHSYAIKRRFSHLSDEHGGMPGEGHLARVIDLDFPAMRQFFAVERVNDNGARRRIACLEYLARRFGSI